MKKYTTVNEFLTDLDASRRAQVNLLRQIIMSSIAATEHIKWNAPSYVCDGEDRVTFNLHGDDMKILIHMGATKKEDKTAKPVMDDTSGLVHWNSNIRGTVSFASIEDIEAKRDDFSTLLSRWILLTD